MGEVTSSPPRPLTLEERVVLDSVIDANPEHRDALRALFADTRVTSVCAADVEVRT